MKLSYISVKKLVFCSLLATLPFDTPTMQAATVSDDVEYTCVEVPRSMVFCGETVDLSRFDRRERMDRELLAFSFMHSTSIQMIKRANRYFPCLKLLVILFFIRSFARDSGIKINHSDFYYWFLPHTRKPIV